MSTSRDTDAILRNMAQIRCDLYEDVEGIVENARVISDWRHYVKSYPWASLAAAAAVGYVLVPQRIEIVSPDARTLAKLAKQNRLVVTSAAEPHVKQGGLAAGLLAMASSLLLKGVMAYAGQQASRIVGEMGRPAGEQPVEAPQPAAPGRTPRWEA